jgi:hypothetical protein
LAVHQRGNVVGLENTIGQMFREANVKSGAGAQGKVSPAYQSWVIIAADIPDDRRVVGAK